MANILAFGIPVVALIVAAIGMGAVRHSTKMLKEKIAKEHDSFATQGTVVVHEAPEGYGEVHTTIRVVETV